MDTFMDKFAQRKRAQGMIDANAAADAAKMEQLQRQVNEYDLLLQEIRKVNLKTAENAGQMSKAIQAGIEKIEAFQADHEAQDEQEKLLSEIQGQLEALLTEMKKQNEMCLLEVRQQKEVLASETKKQTEMFLSETKKQTEMLLSETKKQTEMLLSETKKQTEMVLPETKKQTEMLLSETKKQTEMVLPETKKQIEMLLSETKKQTEMLLSEAKKRQETLSGEIKNQMEAFLPEIKKQVEAVSRQSDDFSHKESVKVYRNVQAAMMEELGRQTEALTALQKESGKKQKAVLPLTIIVLLLLLADIAVHLFNFTLF